MGGPRVHFAIVSFSRSPALPAGVTWTSRTTSAAWAARSGHTSVIDAAGTIYVIGGVALDAPAPPRYLLGGGSYFKDVWASTNGGADRTRRVLRGYLRGTLGYLRGTLGYLRGARQVLEGYSGVLEGYSGVSRGARQVLEG
jgi:hypothetical protein